MNLKQSVQQMGNVTTVTNLQVCPGCEISNSYPHLYPQTFFVDIHGYIHRYTHGLPIACLWLTCKIAATIPQSTTGGRASYQNDHDAGNPF